MPAPRASRSSSLPAASAGHTQPPAGAKRWTSEVGEHLFEKLTDEERRKMEELRRACADVLTSEHDDLFLIRFCRARDFKMDKVEAMLRQALMYMWENDITWRAWQNEFMCDRRARIYPTPRVNNRYAGLRASGQDKDGAPLIWDFVGQRDNIGLLRCMTAEEWTRSCQYFCMALHDYRTHTAPRGAECEMATWIFDVSKLSLKQMLYMPFVRADQEAIWFVQNCLPEQLKRVFVINAPKAFTFVWAVYKVFLDKNTRDKVSILGTNFLPELLKHIDADQIPAFLGGAGSDEPAHHPGFGWIVTEDGRVEPTPDDDPWVLSGPIPESMYRAGLEKDKSNEIVVASKTTEEVEVLVAKPGAKIRWHFQTLAYDVGFGVLQKTDEGASREVIKLSRVNADTCPQRGEVVVHEPGTYKIVFDNTYSKYRAKTVTYTVDVIDPADLETGASRGARPRAEITEIDTDEESGDGDGGQGAQGRAKPRRSSQPLPKVSYPPGRRVYCV